MPDQPRESTLGHGWVCARLDTADYAAVVTRATAEGRTVSDVVRDLLRRYGEGIGR